MTGIEPPGFDPFEESHTLPHQLTGESVATETIDLTSGLFQDVRSSGTYDLSSIGSTWFGHLLDALPIPAIVIDQWNQVGFANQSCGKISPEYKKMQGVSFLDFVPRPSETERAQALADKTVALLDKVFMTRKPQVAEAILDIFKHRIWARLHLRAVRIGPERHLLVLIEDLTCEKRQIELNRRQEKEFNDLLRDLEASLQESYAELSKTSERLKREVTDHLRTQRALRTEKQKTSALSEQASLASAVVGPTGTFQEIDPGFTEMFGFDLGEFPNLTEWVIGCGRDKASFNGMVSTWLDSLHRPCEDTVSAESSTVICQGGTKKEVHIRGVRLDDGNYFITCQESTRTLSKEAN